MFGKSRKLDVRDTCREITTVIFARSTSRQKKLERMSKLLHVSRKTLQKHTKFKVQVNENDESSCWALITMQPYQGNITVGIKAFVVEFLESHSHVIQDIKNGLRHHIAKGEYVYHAKHAVEMTKVALFEEF